MEGNPLSQREWLQHAYEECLDQAVYLRRLMEAMDALKAPAPTPSNSAELEPATPWYPEDSGKWVEVPPGSKEMPASLSPNTLIEGLSRYEREEQVYSDGPPFPAHKWIWDMPQAHDCRLVAYKVFA